MYLLMLLGESGLLSDEPTSGEVVVRRRKASHSSPSLALVISGTETKSLEKRSVRRRTEQ